MYNYLALLTVTSIEWVLLVIKSVWNKFLKSNPVSGVYTHTFFMAVPHNM